MKIEELQAVASTIRTTLAARQMPYQPFAFCVIAAKYSNQQDQVFWTASPLDGTQAPHSSIIRMLQFVAGWNGLPRERRYHCHVYASDNYPLTQMCQGMVRFLQFSMPQEPRVQPVPGPPPGGSTGLGVAISEITQDLAERAELDAFSISAAGPEPVGVDLLSAATSSTGQKQSTLHRIYMMAAFALVAGRFANNAVEGHNIGAILVNRHGRILSWGLNQSNVNNSFHAEVNTLQAYWKRYQAEIPPGSVLFTTLKPCKMCAGMIAHTGVQRVYVGQDDPGSHAQETALDGLQQQKLFILGQDSTKPVKVYSTNRYDARSTQANLKQQDLTVGLQQIHTSSSNDQITKTLNTDMQWRSAVSLTSRTLLRKVHKYVSDQWRNQTVFSVLWHVAPLVEAHGNNEYRQLFQLFKKERQQPLGTSGPAVASPLLDKSMQVDTDTPSTFVNLQPPQLSTASPFGMLPQPPTLQTLPAVSNSFSSFEEQKRRQNTIEQLQILARSRLMWELDYGVGPLFDQRLSGKPGKFAELRGQLVIFIGEKVAQDITTPEFNPWAYHEGMVSLLVQRADEFCGKLGV